MKGGLKFKELRVWQKGKDLAVYIYQITNAGDFAKDYREEAGEEMILHYTKRGKLVKIEILDASKTVIDFLEPILSQKPLATAVSY